jgi:hypothetical protein
MNVFREGYVLFRSTQIRIGQNREQRLGKIGTPETHFSSWRFFYRFSSKTEFGCRRRCCPAPTSVGAGVVSARAGQAIQRPCPRQSASLISDRLLSNRVRAMHFMPVHSSESSLLVFGLRPRREAGTGWGWTQSITRKRDFGKH